jgi:GT2 family glycosyltransferase
MSIINQTFLPSEIILVDDNEKKEFYNIPIFKEFLKLCEIKNIEFSYYYGESKGQVFAQQIAFDHSNYPFIFKLDDDNILEPNTLGILYETMMNNSCGAVSCLILTKKDMNRKLDYTSEVYNKIEDIYSLFNIQMIKNQTDSIKYVEHLHSCYLFKKSVTDGYALEFSPSGHREDTVFTYQIFLKGHKLIVNPNTIIWHLKEEKGGNRLQNDGNKNELLFIEKLKEWKVIPDKLELISDGIIYVIKDNIKYRVL